MTWLIVANGEKLSQARLRQLATDRSVLACDGAIHDCIQHEIPVDILIGDFDSVSSLQPLAKYTSLQIISAPDQNKTDSEKAFIHLIDIGCDDIIICQAMGDRTDHNLINLGLLSRYHALKRKLILAREYENIFFAQDTIVTLHGKKGDPVAILGFSEAIITTQGLKYESDHLKLHLTGVSSGCNELLNTEAKIHVVGEALISFASTCQIELSANAVGY